MQIILMRAYLRQALFDALAELGNDNREMVLCYLQKEHKIRFTAGSNPSVEEIKSALQETFGSSARIFVGKFEKELEKYPIPLLRI